MQKLLARFHISKDCWSFGFPNSIEKVDKYTINVIEVMPVGKFAKKQSEGVLFVNSALKIPDWVVNAILVVRVPSGI